MPRTFAFPPRRRACLALGAALSLVPSSQAQLVHGQMVLEEFTVGAFWEPQRQDGTDAEFTARMQDLRAANFNLVGNINYDPRTFAEHQNKLQLIAGVPGLRMMIVDQRFADAKDGNHPCCTNPDAVQVAQDYRNNLPQNLRDLLFGYYISDEPLPSEISRVTPWSNHFFQQDPSKVNYVNFLPHVLNTGGETRYWNSFAAYSNAVISHFQRQDVRVSGFDYYPFTTTTTATPHGWQTYFETRTHYFRNLQLFANQTSSRGKTFFAYPLSVQHGNYLDPTPNNLRFMAFAPLLYGAKGLIYYTYLQPRAPSGPGSDPGYPFPALLDANYNINHAIYDQVLQINGEIANLGPVLMNLNWRGTAHGDITDPSSQENPLPTAVGGGLVTFNAGTAAKSKLVASWFIHRYSRRPFLMVMNKDRVNAITANVTAFGKVQVFRHLKSARARALIATTPSGANTAFSINLAPGDAELFECAGAYPTAIID